ncbi:helix-turn-helix domain-containing protein [Cylindrospermopsis phage Cr-LKS4]|jgi:DNA-binding CsgD family transcriptional regulator|nr:helix-turn-helix domain-containing protein [Cylindrospermopsis phage Cr-LKS4]WHL30670.1 helix-turn-helix domain-containing protein [Cylindrospermopsis phage Cr-LKS4]
MTKKTVVKSRKIDMEQVRELLESGLSNVQIGLIIGRHSSTVGDYRDKLGIRANLQEDSMVTSAQVKTLYASGMKQIEIARKLGITRQRVSKILK